MNNLRFGLINTCYVEQTATFVVRESGNMYPVALSLDQIREEEHITYIDRAKMTVERVQLDGKVWLRVALSPRFELRGEPKFKRTKNGQEGAF